MESNNHSDNDRVLDEVLITREYVSQVSDSLHQQIWEVRRVAQETRYIVGFVLGLVCLTFLILCWEFIAALFIWMAGFILILHKNLEPIIDSIKIHDVLMVIFWSLIIFIAGFLVIFFVLAAKILSISLWSGSKLQIRTRQIFSKRNTRKIQTELAGDSNEKFNIEKTAYSQRMNEYLKEAEIFLDKKKEAKFKG